MSNSHTQQNTQIVSLFVTTKTQQQHNIKFKGALSRSAIFSYVETLILPSSETYLLSLLDLCLSHNQAKTKNPGNSEARKNGYPEQ